MRQQPPPLHCDPRTAAPADRPAAAERIPHAACRSRSSRTSPATKSRCSEEEVQAQKSGARALHRPTTQATASTKNTTQSLSNQQPDAKLNSVHQFASDYISETVTADKISKLKSRSILTLISNRCHVLQHNCTHPFLMLSTRVEIKRWLTFQNHTLSMKSKSFRIYRCL